MLLSMVMGQKIKMSQKLLLPNLNLRAHMVAIVLFMTLLAIVTPSLHLDLSVGKVDTSWLVLLLDRYLNYLLT